MTIFYSRIRCAALAVRVLLPCCLLAGCWLVGATAVLLLAGADSVASGNTGNMNNYCIYFRYIYLIIYFQREQDLYYIPEISSHQTTISIVIPIVTSKT